MIYRDMVDAYLYPVTDLEHGSMPETSKDRLKRRKFLTTVGGAGVAGLAGCNSGTDQEGDSPTPTETRIKTDTPGGIATTVDDTNDTKAPVVDKKAVVGQASLPISAQTNWNNFTTGNVVRATTNFVGRMHYDPIFWFNDQTGKFVPGVGKNVEFDQNGVTIHLQEDATYEDGKPYTAKDLWAAEIIGGGNLGEGTGGSPEWVEKFEVIDDKTFKYHTKKPVNQDWFMFNVVGDGTRNKTCVRYDVYKKYVDKIANADSAEERRKAYQNMVGQGSDKKAFEIGDEAPLSHGPFKFQKRGPRTIEMDRNENYRLIENVNYAGGIYKYYGKGGNVWQAMKQGEIQSGGPNVTKSLVDNKPDHIHYRLLRLYAARGINLRHAHVDMGKRKFRQAMMWAMNRKQMSQNQSWPETRIPVQTPNGLLGLEKKYFGKELLGKMKTYDPGKSNFKKATELLESEGYSKDGGKWYRPNGDRVTLRLVNYSTSDIDVIAQTAKQQLRDFGFKIDHQVVDVNAIYETLNRGNWEFMIQWNGGFKPDPYSNYFIDMIVAWPYDIEWPNENSSGTAENPDYTVEVPWPVGDWKGSPKEVDVKGLLDELRGVQDNDRMFEIIRTLGWVYNVELPRMTLLNVMSPRWWATAGPSGEQEWEAAPESDKVWAAGASESMTYATRKGKFRAKS